MWMPSSAQRRFQLFDRAAYGRLGDVQPAGRARETQIFGYSLKISEMPQFVKNYWSGGAGLMKIVATVPGCGGLKARMMFC